MSIQQKILDAVENSGYDVQFRNYSGRAMYGKQCVGIVGEMKVLLRVIKDVITEDSIEVFQEAVHAEGDEEFAAADKHHDEHLNLIRAILNFQTDSMGLDMILYWPNIPYENLEDDVEEDDE